MNKQALTQGDEQQLHITEGTIKPDVFYDSALQGSNEDCFMLIRNHQSNYSQEAINFQRVEVNGKIDPNGTTNIHIDSPSKSKKLKKSLIKTNSNTSSRKIVYKHQ